MIYYVLNAEKLVNNVAWQKNMRDDLAIVLRTVKTAGAAILQIQKNDITVTHKANQDIVTQADLLANTILKQELLQHFPGTGWLSEECVDDLERMQAKQTWIIDP